MPVTHQVEVTETGRIDRILAASLSDLSRSRIAALVKQGAVTVRGAIVKRPSTEVVPGDVVVVLEPDAVPDHAVPQDIPVDIVYQDADLAIINKAAGMVVHPAAGHPDGTLVNALLHHLDGLSGIGGVSRPGIVHRLDRGTSGLMVVAKHDLAHQALAAQFADHSANRRYVAVCFGAPSQPGGTIESLVSRHPRDRMRWASTRDGRGKRAITHWERLGVADGICLIGCKLETGRTHQVRVHLTESGHPLLGDPVYKRRGNRLPARLKSLVADQRPLLHAWRLELTHPTTNETVVFTTPPPLDMLRVVHALGLQESLPV